MVAVYSTHPTAPLALCARTRSFTAAAYRRIDRDRAALRIPGMRRTIFLVPRENAARVFTSVRPSRAHAFSSLRQHGLSTRDYERLAARILAVAETPRSTRDLEEAARIKGQELGAVLRSLRYEGRLLVLSGESLLGSPHRYVATSSWVPEGLDGSDPADGLAWLAGEYLRAYGPARAEDFSWWAGVAKRAAGRAVRSHHTVELGGELLLLAEDEPAFSRVKRIRNTVDLLPKWDAYTMGHAPDGRQRFVHPEVQRQVYTPIGVGLAGDGNPVVLVDGEAAGTWTHTVKHGVDMQPFDAFGLKVRRRVGEKLEAVARLLAS